MASGNFSFCKRQVRGGEEVSDQPNRGGEDTLRVVTPEISGTERQGGAEGYHLVMPVTRWEKPRGRGDPAEDIRAASEDSPGCRLDLLPGSGGRATRCAGSGSSLWVRALKTRLRKALGRAGDRVLRVMGERSGAELNELGEAVQRRAWKDRAMGVTNSETAGAACSRYSAVLHAAGYLEDEKSRGRRHHPRNRAC